MNEGGLCACIVYALGYASFGMASLFRVGLLAWHVPDEVFPMAACLGRVVAPPTWQSISMPSPSIFSALDAGDLRDSLSQRRPLVCFF